MNFIASLLVVITTFCLKANCNCATDGTELVFSFLVHRHGDRTPTSSSLLNGGIASGSEELMQLIEPWGFGQLTNKGRRTGYKVGKFIRRRYNSLLSPIYNRSEVYIRSTDSTRTKMTALTALSAVYPAIGDTWSDKIDWVPVPYTTVPVIYDWNLGIYNCPTFSSGFQNRMLEPTRALDPYMDVLSEASEFLPGVNLTQSPVACTVFTICFTLSLGYDIVDGLEALLPQLYEAAGAAMNVIFGNEDYIALQAGVLLNEFFNFANQIINGTETQRVRWYSAHDINVFSFEAATQVPRSVPTYGAVLSLELRKVVDIGEYVVLPVYLPSPDEDEVYLPVSGCGYPCPIDTFYAITSKYALDEQTWRANCGWTENQNLSTGDID